MNTPPATICPRCGSGEVPPGEDWCPRCEITDKADAYAEEDHRQVERRREEWARYSSMRKHNSRRREALRPHTPHPPSEDPHELLLLLVQTLDRARPRVDADLASDLEEAAEAARWLASWGEGG